MDDPKGKVFSKRWMIGTITTIAVVIVGVIVGVGMLLPWLRGRYPKQFK